LSGTDPSAQSGPAYGPLLLEWSGEASVSGKMVALGFFAGGDAGVSWAYGEGHFAASRGETAHVELGMSSIQVVTVGGSVRISEGYYLAQVLAYYRYPLIHAGVEAASDQSGHLNFSLAVPDLLSSASLCVEATSSSSPGTMITTVCGNTSANKAVIQLQAPPGFSPPFDGTSLSSNSSLSWTQFDDGVYEVSLQLPSASRATPTVNLFTSRTSLSWTQLEAMGVPFPIGSTYQLALEGRGPFASMDEAAGPDGMGAPFPTERRWCYSPSANVLLTP
jgi:hypothetical protein